MSKIHTNQRKKKSNVMEIEEKSLNRTSDEKKDQWLINI